MEVSSIYHAHHGGPSQPHAARLTLTKTLAIVLIILLCVAVIVALQSSTAATASTQTSKHDVILQSVPANAVLTTTNDQTTTPAPAAKSTGATTGPVSNNASTKTQVTVNNQAMSVPENGTTSQTVQSPDGTSTVQISSTNQGGVSNSSFSSLTVQTITNSDESGSSSQSNWSAGP